MDNGHEPATKNDIAELRAEMKQDIAELRAEMKQDIAELRTEMKSDIAAVRDELLEAMRDSETKLLKAFYTFAEANHQRVSLLESSQSAVIVRLATLESRITMVEKHLNLPPAA